MNTEKENLSDLARKAIEPRIIEAKDGTQFLISNKEMNVEDVTKTTEKHLDAPRRRTGNTTLARLHSYIDFTNRYKSEDSIILVEGKVSKNTIQATALTLFNADPAGGDQLKAGHGDFKCDYKFPVSKELGAFVLKNGVGMSQADFALFLEDHISDMSSPNTDEQKSVDGTIDPFKSIERALGGKGADPITMLELARGLEVRVTETVTNQTKLASGEMSFKFSAEHGGVDGKPLNIPVWFLIRVPLFEGGAPIDIPVRLRYRVKEGTITWFYELYRMNEAFDKAFDDAVQFIKEKTELPVFIV